MNDSLLLKMLCEFPYLQSSLSVIDVALNLADFKPNDVFADLGCGDGAVLIRAAERFGVFSVGFEVDRKLVVAARENVRAAGFKHLVDVVHSDLFRVDLSRFDVVYVYPHPLIVKSLSEKIVGECPSGSRVLVHDYALNGLRPVTSVHIPGEACHTYTVYLYKF
ncbi:MAG: methyltransferase domain-containing protein [Candidatus Bathyarchaeia archaeon]